MVSTPPTFSLQHTLPRLPVPSLEETCTLYLQTLVPFQTPEEHEKSKKIVHDFMNSKLANSLQQRLIDIDRSSPKNWLEDNFWIKKAYLEWREPLMVNSNWYVLGQHDINHPPSILESRKSGTFSHFQIRRAAHMIMRGLKYKEMVDRQEIPIDMMRGNQAQCMLQYGRIFSVTRVPLYHCDNVVQADPSQIHHIVVIVRDQVYKLPVYKEIGKNIWQALSTDEIEQGLLDIVHHVDGLKAPSAPIPLFTSWYRDGWTMARNHLVSIDPKTNRDHLNTIESALFAVALDDHSNGIDSPSFTKTAMCGNQGLGNGHNRWYDKSFTMIVENNGACCFSGEHSPVDALIVSLIFDYMLQEPVTGTLSPDWIQTGPARNAQHLNFVSDATISSYLEQAQKQADETAAFSDSDVLVFKDYGMQWIKKSGRVPPDAYLQMALQLAYYRLMGTITPVYETASTRKYLCGRTETIRSTSADSKAFLEAFDNATMSAKEKYDLLSKAANSHRKYTQIASDGHGCDRHLLILRLLNADHQDYVDGKPVPVAMHPIFTDPIHAASQTWKLSTSGLHAGIRLLGTGFGAVVPDGFGTNYMPAPTLIKFGIESKRIKGSHTTADFIGALDKALKDMRVLCEQVHGAKL